MSAVDNKIILQLEENLIRALTMQSFPEHNLIYFKALGAVMTMHIIASQQVTFMKSYLEI